MDEDLVLLTSYFNLANGRRQDTADTFRVDPSLPSSTSPDGTAALYIVTEASTGGHMGPRVRRLAADTIAWEYSTHSQDPPASRLKTSLRAAHDQIRNDLDGHVSVGASVIAVEHKDVFLAQVAPAQVYVLHEGSLHSIAATVGGSSPFANALGAARGPHISLFRDSIEPGDILALCSSWFHQSADPEELRDCFGAGNADDVAEALLALAQEHDVRDASCIVVEVAEASDLEIDPSERAPGLMQQVDGAMQALANIGRLILAELRPDGAVARRTDHISADDHDEEEFVPRRSVAVSPRDEEATSEVPQVGARTVDRGRVAVDDDYDDDLDSDRFGPYPDASSPLDDSEPDDWNPDDTETLDLQELQEADRAHRRAMAREHATEEVPAVAADDSMLPSDPTEEPPEWEGAEQVEREPEGLDRSSGARPISELDEVNYRLRTDDDLGDVMPPVQTFEEPSTTEPSRIYPTSPEIRRVNRRPRRFGGYGGREGAGSAPVVRPRLSDLDLRRPMVNNAPPWVVWLAAAVLAIFVVFGAYEILHHRHSTVATNPFPAKFAHNLALARAATLPAQQDADLARARADITLAQQNGAKLSEIRSLHQQLAAAQDAIYKITREVPVEVAKFQQPAELALNPQAVYVLDAGKKGIFSVSPNSNSSPTEIIQAGETDSGILFDVPQHLATAGSVALAIDENDTLVSYSSDGTKTATRLQAPTPTEKNAAMANFGPDVYLLDAAGNQIYRYADAVGGSSSVAGDFFNPNTPNVDHIVAFTLDDKDMYLLKSTGTILKFDTQQATAQPWQAHDPALRGALSNPNAIFTDVGLNYVWVADPANGRIVQFDKSGKYIREYEADPNSTMDFGRIKSIGVPSDGNTLYVLAGTQLFKFPVSR